MGFFKSLKKVATDLSKQLREKEVEISARDLAEKWDKIKSYKPKIGIKRGGETYWYPLERVWTENVEVGLFRKSQKEIVFVEYWEPNTYYDEEEEEDRGWFEEEEYIKTERFSLDDKVRLRFTLANYEKLVEREGEIL
ncbi:hypothetical protein [Pyrococcus sp. ST04]|uniref:hypothetical protein n=1 Tax=Pyrococcus sp. ST04 TaxID=1183377 RepID=UPI0002605A6A|nr:hypothetical protein [Pyrococcus sp. ST04]AFK22043.1 hypothetical protein Py04_0441 [Pyrococcus sp. ST04]